MTQLKPPIHWYGGKSKMMDELLPFMPPHKCHVEPFAGAGAFLFAKPPSKVEIYNDKHKWLVNLYMVMRGWPEEFHKVILQTPYSKEELERSWELLQCISLDLCLPNIMIEAARCFYVIARQSFSGRHDRKPGWSSSKQTNHALAWMNAIEGLPAIYERLRNVQIECGDGIEVIRKYDGEDVFMYIDPPYLAETRKTEQAYEHEFDDLKHMELLGTLLKCQSMILLSGYSNEVYDNVLCDWHTKSFDVTSSAGQETENVNRERTETIWWNPALDRQLLPLLQMKG